MFKKFSFVSRDQNFSNWIEDIFTKVYYVHSFSSTCIFEAVENKIYESSHTFSLYMY